MNDVAFALKFVKMETKSFLLTSSSLDKVDEIRKLGGVPFDFANATRSVSSTAGEFSA
jgi:hypothetical protein